MIFFGVFLLSNLMNINTTITISNTTQEKPPGYFNITLIAATSNPARVQHAQVITRELWKIGIDAELALVGWDPLNRRLMESVNFETSDGDGFDIGFVGSTAGNPLNPGSLSQFYHSNRIDKIAGDSNWYPINNSKLDELVDLVDAELDFDQRREYVRQALDIIVWEEHPVMGLYQAANPFALDADIRGFDAFRWGQPNTHLPELYYESGTQDTFKFASNAWFIDLNPALSNSYYDSLFHQPTQAWTYQRDANMLFKPVLATADPIPVGSNDTIASTIPVASITDGPYLGADALTTWGASPNVNASQFNPFKSADDYSMFLINLREDIPYHPGWGYELWDVNVTIEDFQWTLSYWMDEDLASQAAQGFENWYGPTPELAIQKINATMFKLNLRGRLGHGQVADWLDACALRPLPRHVLDPTFDATPYGGSVGVTPDGTTIAAYVNHSEYEFNTGEKPIIGVGAYQFISWDGTNFIGTLEKFDAWGNGLWGDARFSMNNIDTYNVIVYPSKEAAEIALENSDIDGIDAQFQMGPDIPSLQTKPNIQIILSEGGGIQTMGYNTYHPRLSNHYVRLAISHMIPAQRIVEFILGDLGTVNEVVGLHSRNPFMPSKEEWNTLGLDTAENIIAPETSELLEFQGHISYNIHKAWALMEKAGYDMDPWREAVPEWEKEDAFRSSWPFDHRGFHHHYNEDYNLTEPSEWGLQPGDTISWKFEELEYRGSISLEEPFENIPTRRDNGKKETKAIPLHEDSLISILIVDLNESLWIQKEIDGIQGLTEQLDKVPYIIPLNFNWTDYWFIQGYKVEKNDNKRCVVVFEHDDVNASYRLEFDKKDGILRRFEMKSQIYDQQAQVLLVRTTLTEDDSLERLFIDIITRELPIFALATLGASIAGIGLAQLLKMRRTRSKSLQSYLLTK
jgi:ABC-type transport system substrate-binding protein